MAAPSDAISDQAAASAHEAEGPSAASTALDEWNYEYEKMPDGRLFVAGDLRILHKGLTKLPDLSSVVVANNFDCSHNQLTSLEGAPLVVGGGVWCNDNRLASLEHVPAVFRLLHSDFGEFLSFDAVPAELCPETKARRHQEKLEAAEEKLKAEVRGATVLQTPIAVKAPLKFKPR